MKTQKVPISQVSIDPHNPRTITKEKFQELKQSIIDFPEMQLVKPLIVADGLVIGGNMRLLAFKDLGYREVHIIDVTTWTQAKRDEFMIRDNTHYGVWDYDALANEWDTLPLNDWGLEVWQPEEDISNNTDYSINSLDEKLDRFLDAKIKNITIPFETEEFADVVNKLEILLERYNCQDYRALIYKIIENEKI